MAQLIRGLVRTVNVSGGGVVTIGNFDGVHRGHQALLARVCSEARQREVPAIVVTFEPQPQTYFARLAAKPGGFRLSSLRMKYQHLLRAGIDAVWVIRFDQTFSRLSPEDFVQQLLVGVLDASHVVVGQDFHFGCGRAGSIETLELLGKKWGFTVACMPDLLFAGERISSSRVRNALQDGNFSLAEQLLGYQWVMEGRVIHGDRFGRQLGFPTANIDAERYVPPLSGIYAVQVGGLAGQLSPVLLDGVASLGMRPAVRGKKRLLEVHLFDFAREIYGRRITVCFRHKLRDECDFASPGLLQQQIARDVEMAKNYFRGACRDA